MGNWFGGAGWISESLRIWLWAVLVFGAALAAGMTGWRILHRRLERWAEKSVAEWDDILVRNIRFPGQALVFVAALGIASTVAPEAVRGHPIVSYGGRIAFIAMVAWISDRLLATAVQSKVLSNALGTASRTLILTACRVALGALLGLVILDTVGISITPLLASLGVGSVAVALAAQETLSNLFSGIYILIDRPVRLGDFVQVDDVHGTIVKIGWRSTHIRGGANTTIILPNSRMASSRVINFDLPDRELGMSVDVGVGYGSDLSHVEKVTVEVAREVLRRVPGGVAAFEPAARYQQFADSSINLKVILRVRQFADQDIVRHELIKALHARYRAERIDIPFPSRTVHLAAAAEALRHGGLEKSI